MSTSSINWRLFKESYLDRAPLRGAVPALSYAYHEGPGRWLGYACLAELGFQTGQFHRDHALELAPAFKDVVSQRAMQEVFKKSSKPALVNALLQRLSEGIRLSNAREYEPEAGWNTVVSLWVHAQEASLRNAVELLDREAAAATPSSMSIKVRVQRLLRERLTEDEAADLVQDLALVSEFVELHAHVRALVAAIPVSRVSHYVRNLFDATAFNAKGRELHNTAIAIWSTLNPAAAEPTGNSFVESLAPDSANVLRKAYE